MLTNKLRLGEFGRYVKFERYWTPSDVSRGLHQIGSDVMTNPDTESKRFERTKWKLWFDKRYSFECFVVEASNESEDLQNMSPNISDIQTESTSPAKGLCCSMMFLLQYDYVCSFSRLCVFISSWWHQRFLCIMLMSALLIWKYIV